MKNENDLDFKAAFDGMDAEQTDALLRGIETADASERMLRSLKTRTEEKLGYGENSALPRSRGNRIAKGLSLRAKRVLAAAAALVFVLGAVLGGSAYAKAAKEYNEAIGFFNANQLPTEGLSRKEIREVYRSIKVEHLSQSGEGIVSVGQYSFDVSGIELSEHPASETDFAALWKQHRLDSVPESEEEYTAETYGGLLKLYDDGVHDISRQEYGEGDYSVGTAILERYRRSTEEWQCRTDYCTVDAFEVFDDCVISVGRRGNDPARGIGVIGKFDEKSDGFHSVGNLLDSRRTFSILEDDDRNYVLFAAEGGYDTDGYRIWMLRFSKYYLHLISETAIDCPAGYYPVRAVRFGTGYAVLLQAAFLDWMESNGDMTRQIVAFIDAEGRLTGTAPAALDAVARETLEARVTEELAPDDPAALISVDLEDSCFVIVDMLEYRGKLYFSGYALPRGGYTQFDEPNPSSHHDEIMPLVMQMLGSDPSEEEFTALLRANYTALLLEYDPAGGQPTAFALEAGALGNSLREDESGRLVWNICSLGRAVFSPFTSAYTVLGYASVFEYRFTASGAVIAADTGARTMFMR